MDPTGRFIPLRRLVPFLLIAAAACGDSPSAPFPETRRAVSPDVQWSGGEIRIALEGLDPTKVEAVLAGSDSLEFAPSGSTALLARLPVDANGARDIWLETPGRKIPAGSVDVRGFAGSEEVEPALTRGIRDWETGFGAAVIGSTDRGLAIIRPGSHGGVHFEGIHNRTLMYAAGRSADPLEVYGWAGREEPLVQWRLTTAVPPTPLDSFPVSASWSLARGAPDIWFLGYHHRIEVRRGPAPDGSVERLYETQAEETLDWEFLPALDRVAPSTGGFFEGLPVFDTETGEIAFRVESLLGSRGLLALPGTGQFAVAGWVGPAAIALTIFDGLTGEVAISRPLAGTAADIEVDTARGVLYVLHGHPAHGAVIGVYDATTLEEIGLMTVPTLVFSDVELVLDADALYAVFGGARPSDRQVTGTLFYRYQLR